MEEREKNVEVEVIAN